VRPAQLSLLCGAAVALLSGVALAAGPTITVTTPVNGEYYALNQRVTADFACPGAQSCVGTVADGMPIDTSKYGSFSFTVTAKGDAGQSAARTFYYNVYNANGAKPPPPRPTPSVLMSGTPSSSGDQSSTIMDPGITVVCPAGGDSCSGDQTATTSGTATASSTRVHKRTIGKAHFTIAAGKRLRLRLALNHDGVKLLLGSRSLRVTFTVTSRKADGPATRTTRTVTIARPKAKKT